MSPADVSELKAEYEVLAKIKRPAAVKRLAEARDQGDLSENSEYAAAKQDLEWVLGKTALKLWPFEKKVKR